jgi:hypothetical protein
MCSYQECHRDGNDKAGSEPDLTSQVLVDGEAENSDRNANRHNDQ